MNNTPLRFGASLRGNCWRLSIIIISVVVVVVAQRADRLLSPDDPQDDTVERAVSLIPQWDDSNPQHPVQQPQHNNNSYHGPTCRDPVDDNAQHCTCANSQWECADGYDQLTLCVDTGLAACLVNVDTHQPVCGMNAFCQPCDSYTDCPVGQVCIWYGATAGTECAAAGFTCGTHGKVCAVVVTFTESAGPGDWQDGIELNE